MLGLTGVTAMDVSTAGVTVNVCASDTMPVVGSVAVMCVVPCATGVARPCDKAALLMVAVAVVPEAHVTAVVMTCCVPLL